MNVLVVAPMTREARAIGDGAIAVGAGARAAAHLRAMPDNVPFDALVIAGICGALDPSLKPGDIVVSRSVLAESLPEIMCDARLLDAARAALRANRPGRPLAFVSSRLLTTRAPVTGVDARRGLWNAFGAAGVDMETYSLVEAAVERGMPWIAVRAVSDGARAPMPSSIAAWRDESDDGRIARAMARRPGEWASALRLALGTRAALRALAVAVPLVVGALEALDVAAGGPAPQRGSSGTPGAALERTAGGRRARVR